MDVSHDYKFFFLVSFFSHLSLCLCSPFNLESRQQTADSRSRSRNPAINLTVVLDENLVTVLLPPLKSIINSTPCLLSFVSLSPSPVYKSLNPPLFPSTLHHSSQSLSHLARFAMPLRRMKRAGALKKRQQQPRSPSFTPESPTSTLGFGELSDDEATVVDSEQSVAVPADGRPLCAELGDG
ncbi:hypothetical protein H6P81_015215 [Aristolochia fimbriata]|uniref:Uncharacterized protein n=1 Tax=Aristolochia fimbriata TaxID=158543 RepID=A0AAV7E6Y0_ARIFI|nr:hypothetical protein H6P81_015215 [Aristolochia fimbriata]